MHLLLFSFANHWSESIGKCLWNDSTSLRPIAPTTPENPHITLPNLQTSSPNLRNAIIVFSNWGLHMTFLTTTFPHFWHHSCLDADFFHVSVSAVTRLSSMVLPLPVDKLCNMWYFRIGIHLQENRMAL